jgi:hypothetical protein
VRQPASDPIIAKLTIATMFDFQAEMPRLKTRGRGLDELLETKGGAATVRSTVLLTWVVRIAA